jgi:hypothetical protein
MKSIHRIEETAKVQERIDALEYAIECTRGRRDKATCLGNMLAEYTSRRKYLCGVKEFMVHFEGGGWNTCYGITQEDAFDNACLEFNKEATPDGHVAMKVRSVSLATSEGIASAMRLFY